MLTLTDQQWCLHVCILIALFGISNTLSDRANTTGPVISCPYLQLLCGGSTCYDPFTQRCTVPTGKIECFGVCGDHCFNPNTHQCLNGTLCGLHEQLCTIKYSIYSSSVNDTPIYNCYNPTYQACLNNTLCDPYDVCGEQCRRADQLCINNKTICQLRNGSTYYYEQSGWTTYQSCDGICYNSFREQCIHGTIQCIDNNNCSGTCYNSTTHKCFNGTLCSLDVDICHVKYNRLSQSYGLSSYQCYNPTYQVCLNDALCYQSQVCDQQCLRENQLCINNKTICQLRNGTSYYRYSQGLNKYESCNGICYPHSLEQCINGTIQCIDNNNCSGTCYNSSTHKCFNGSLCGLDQDLCYVKYNERSQSHYPSSYQCYNPTYQACLNNAVCQHSQVCEKQCLEENQLCINNKTICHVSDSYGYYYYLSTLAAIESCNGTCYNTGVHECVNDTIQCPHNNNCSGTCYNSSTHKCFNGTLCSLDVDICHVKYNQLGRSNGLPSYQCYNPTYQVCLNDALCYQSQVCDQQCLRENQLCINNKTICNSRNRQWYYDHGPKLNATESCNGICYDLSVEQCTDSTIQCIDNNNCSGICYDPSTHKCLNGILCSVDEDLCIVQYDSWGRHYDSQSVCYKSQYKACLNNTMCYKSRVCDQRCLRDNQLCINNKTICQLRNGGSYYNHEPRFNTYESCNDTCYDPDVHECIDDIIQCINNSHCSSTCYNSSTHKCLNETLCGLDEDLCSVNYYEWDISYYSKPQCYNPRNQACLNHTVCDRSLVCDQQCQRQGQLCTDNKTICNVPSGVSFYAYQSTSPAIKSCNGMCYTVADKECIDGTIQCINNNNCSGTCYNSSIHKCFNGTLCGVNEDLCIVRYSSWGTQYYTQSLCYNPKDQVCLNNTLCHQSRVCKQHCLLEYQLCANNNTACNGTLLNYTRYGENLIHVCGGICYDPSIQRCIDGNVRTFLPETTTGKFVPSDYHSSWWDIFKVNCYILITIFVIFFIIRQLCGWSSTKTEKSIYLDADRIPLMKNDEI